MQNTFWCSIFSRKYNCPLSFPFSDYTYCSNDRFGTYHCANASYFPLYSHLLSPLVSCYACCANANFSTRNVPITYVYLCGLRPSTYQCAPCKRVMCNGLEQVVRRLPDWNIRKRSNCNKGCHFKGYNNACRNRKGWGKRRYRGMVYEDRGEDYVFYDNIDDEAEFMPSLFNEDVGEECLDVRRRLGRCHNKVIVQERRNGADQCGSKKTVDFRTLGTGSKFEYESTVNKPTEEVDRRKEENEALLIIGHQKVKHKSEDTEGLFRDGLMKDEKGELLRQGRMKEREDSLIKHHTQSARNEYSEELLRIEGHKKPVLKDGSSCSSHYSISSMGEYESNNEIWERPDDEEVLMSKYKRDSGKLQEFKFKGKTAIREGYQDEQNLVLKKGKMVEFDRSNFHKELEKKLPNMSIAQTGFHKESNVHDDLSRKASNKKYEGPEEKFASVVNYNKGRTDQLMITNDAVVHKTETIKNYKKFKEHPQGYGANLTSSSSQTLHNQMDDISTTTYTLPMERRKEHKKKKGHIAKEGEYKKFSKHAQSSKSQNFDDRISNSEISTRQKDQVKASHTTLPKVHDANDIHFHHSQVSTQINSIKASQDLTQEVDINRAIISQRQSKHNKQKHEESPSLAYGSYHEPINNTKINEGVGKSNSKETLKKKIGNTTGSISDDADQWSRSKYNIVVADQSSRPLARGDLHFDSRSGLEIPEVDHDSSRENSEHEIAGGSRINEMYEQPLSYISHEDALYSADLMQNPSSYHVGEFMEKVRHGMSSSEIQKKKPANEKKMAHGFNQYEQPVLTKVTSGGSPSEDKEPKSRHPSPSPSPESKGPSVEKCDVDDLPNQETSGAQVLDINPTGSVITKGIGRSLWKVMSDIVHARWVARSTNQSQMSKSDGENSPSQSTSSEPCFSGNEPDETIQEGDKNRKKRVSTESSSVKVPKQEKVQPRGLGKSSSPSSSEDPIHPAAGKLAGYAEISSHDTTSGSNIPSMGEGPSRQQSEDIDSGVLMAAGSSKSPVVRQNRSPYIVGESSASGNVEAPGDVEASGNVDAFGGQEIVQEGEGANEKCRKFVRTNQVVRDRFEEWEEAYNIEAEKRKMDEKFMREALLEARKAADIWEVPVGAVLVHDGTIIARAHNLVEELRDSTAHAEMICIREASNVLRTWRLAETTLYVTLEPCAMCAGAILQARIDVIVWGTPNKLLGADGSWISLFPDGERENIKNSSDKFVAPTHPFHPNIQIRRNVLASECADSMQQFFQRRRKKEKKEEPPPSGPTSDPPSGPTSRLSIFKRPSKFLSKML